MKPPFTTFTTETENTEGDYPDPITSETEKFPDNSLFV
jgi:hypothetical protein